MRLVATWPVVASVKDIHPIRDRSVLQLVSQPMGLHYFAVNLDLTIAKVIYATDPFNALGDRILRRQLGLESIFDCFHKMKMPAW